MSDTLFTDDPSVPPVTPADTAPVAPAPAPVIPAEAADLIGVGKKYATVEAALAALPHAQAHISTLETENQGYKEKLMSNDKLDQVLQRLDTPVPVPVEPTVPDASINRDDLGQLVQQEIAQMEKVNLEKANLTAVESKLREDYGDNVAEVFNAKAAEQGMSPAQLTSLAKIAPQAVLSLVGKINPGAAPPAPTSEGLDLSTLGDIGDTTPKKNIMFGASTQDVMAEWKASAPKQED